MVKTYLHQRACSRLDSTAHRGGRRDFVVASVGEDYHGSGHPVSEIQRDQRAYLCDFLSYEGNSEESRAPAVQQAFCAASICADGDVELRCDAASFSALSGWTSATHVEGTFSWPRLSRLHFALVKSGLLRKDTLPFAFREPASAQHQPADCSAVVASQSLMARMLTYLPIMDFLGPRPHQTTAAAPDEFRYHSKAGSRYEPGMVKSYSHQRACSRLDSNPHCRERRDFIAAFLLLVSAALTACGPSSASARGNTRVLLFTGAGTSPGDVAAIGAILNSSHPGYSTVNSFQLNRMSESQVSGYRLFVVPGGDFVKMGDSLTARTAANVRNAVKGGMNYLGICAGGFLAGSFPAPYNSFNLSSGVKFGFYFPEKNGNLPGPEVGPQYEALKAAVRVTTAEGPALDQYWESGPRFTGWGEVVGKYPDGSPAIVEGSVGKGWVILSGVHPEAPASWRRGMAFSTSVDDDTAYARMLIVAALNGATLSHY